MRTHGALPACLPACLLLEGAAQAAGSALSGTACRETLVLLTIARLCDPLPGLCLKHCCC